MNDSTQVLLDLDAFVDGSASRAERARAEASCAADPRLAAEAAELRGLQALLAEHLVDVRSGFASGVLAAVRSEEAALDALLAQDRVEVRSGFAEDTAAAAVALEIEPAIEPLLAAARVPVRDGFADEVMDRVAAGASSERAWMAWGLAAAALLAVSSGLLMAGSGGSEGFLGALASALSATLLAGAGMLGATWSGVGAAMDAWLGASLATWAVASLVTAGLVFLCARTVRRAKRATVRSRD